MPGHLRLKSRVRLLRSATSFVFATAVVSENSGAFWTTSQRAVDIPLQLKEGQSIERTRVSAPATEPCNENQALPKRVDGFVETSEHRKFVEFSDACKACYRYIGLCYGPPGVGKTLSARRYSRADSLAGYDRWNDATMHSHDV